MGESSGDLTFPKDEHPELVNSRAEEAANRGGSGGRILVAYHMGWKETRVSGQWRRSEALAIRPAWREASFVAKGSPAGPKSGARHG